MVGGGIAGLTLAAALDPRRFAVQLIEAQPDRAATGSVLGLWPSARVALTSIGIDLPAPALGPALEGGGLHAISGRRLVPARDVGVRLVDRPALLSALEAGVPASVERVTAEVTDPADLDADLVVGADGVRSRVRGLVDVGAAERRRTPYVALRGILPGPPAAGTVGEYWGDGCLFGLIPISAEGAYWFVSFRSDLSPEPIPLRAALAEARERFAGAAPVISRTLDRAAPDTLVTRLWVAPPMRRYVHGRYVVVGDAAHAMTPNLGRGACSAIVDAVTLARTLEAGRDLRWWQARRLPATQIARLGSAALMRVALGLPVSR